LTTSNFLNTTINIKKIKLHNHIILDTPGFNSTKNILLNLKDYRDILKLFKKKVVKPLNYQIDKSQSFIADSFLYIKTESSHGSITFYSSLDIDIKRVKTTNLASNLEHISCQYKMKKTKREDRIFDLDPNKHYQFYINGFGKILIKNIIKLTINTFNCVDINKLEYE
jgi:ribosome biogenesis GTPase A